MKLRETKRNYGIPRFISSRGRNAKENFILRETTISR